MSRKSRIAVIISVAFLGLVLALAIAAVLIVHTGWFREQVKEKAISAVESSTGGRAEIGSVSFHWQPLQLIIHNFVLHGTEPAGTVPLLQVHSIDIGVRIVSLFGRKIRLDSVIVMEPRISVRIGSGGATNLPKPKFRKLSGNGVLKKLVNLAVRRFDIENGTIEVDSRTTPFQARGKNLDVLLHYDVARALYKGQLSVAPLELEYGRRHALPAQVAMSFELAGDRIGISSAKIQMPDSLLTFSGTLQHMAALSGTVKLSGTLNVNELAHSLGIAVPIAALRMSPFDFRAGVSFNQESIKISDAVISAGHSEVNASGTIERGKPLKAQFQFKAAAAFADLRHAFRAAYLHQGMVYLSGSGWYSGKNDYSVHGDMRASGLGFHFADADWSGVSAAGGVRMQPGTIEASPLRVNVLDGHFNGRATITDFRNLSADGTVDNLSLREAVRQYTPRKMIWDGFASGPVHSEAVLRGRKEIQASARLTILPGKPGVPVSGKVNVTYRSQSKMATFGPSILETPTTKIGFAGTLGKRLHAKAESTNLDDFLAGLTLVSSHPPKELPFALANGSAKFDGDVIGRPRTPRFAGLASLRNFTFLGRRFDRFEGNIDAASNGLHIRQATVGRAKSVASFSVAMGLNDWEMAANEPVSAKVDIRRADARMLLAMAGQSQVPITGIVAAHAGISGSIGDPRAAADLTVAKGSAYGESFDQLEARLLYTSRMIEWTSARITSGSAQLNSKGSFEHPPGEFREGSIRLQLTGNRIPIGQVKAIKQRLPEISGMLEISASGSIELRPPAARPRILLSALDANVSVEAVKLGRETLGTVSLTTVTQNSLLRFQLRSSLAGAKVQGNGQWRLEDDYPIKAQIEFSPVRFSTLARLLGHPGVLHDMDGTLAGRASVAGPVLQPEALTGSLEVSEFEAFPAVEIGAAKPIAIHAAAPFSVMLQRSTLRLSEARFVGPSTDLAAQGTLRFRDSDPLNLRVRGAVGLAILTYFHPDWDVTGEALLDAEIRGPLKRPGINGQLDLKKAALSIPELPNGLSNVNGVIHFDGQQATIEKLAGELGGGEISFSGSVLYGGTETLFRLHADVKQARIDYPPGASALVNATLDLAGTTRSSLLSGGVTIAAVTFGPHTDLGSLLTRGAQPARVEAPVTGIASTMRLDVHIRTSPDVQFQMPLTESLAADANLQLRGVVASPGLLGRISVTQGKIIFFGNTYTVDQGSISFFNPNAVEPILNLDLQTRVAGIDVILTLSGPIRQLQMSYRSEPPLSFTDIVTLLATGQPPTAQAALLANQPVIPGQTLQPQLGLPTLLTQLVANPVSGRLRRVFGITALSVNPEISQPGGLARVTLQQQITKNVTFTYATDLSATNPQIVRVDWAFNPSWSVVMTRDEAGIVGVDFRYRRSFR